MGPATPTCPESIKAHASLWGAACWTERWDIMIPNRSVVNVLDFPGSDEPITAKGPQEGL